MFIILKNFNKHFYLSQVDFTKGFIIRSLSIYLNQQWNNELRSNVTIKIFDFLLFEYHIGRFFNFSCSKHVTQSKILKKIKTNDILM